MFQGGSLWAGLLTGAMSQVQDTKNLRSGQLSRNEYAVQTTENVTGAVGVMAGVEYGAILGTSVFPGVGTVVGSVVGGLLGDKLGRTIGTRAGSMIFSNHAVNRMMNPASEHSK